jgi:hypothetical protein
MAEGQLKVMEGTHTRITSNRSLLRSYSTRVLTSNCVRGRVVHTKQLTARLSDSQEQLKHSEQESRELREENARMVRAAAAEAVRNAGQLEQAQQEVCMRPLKHPR